MQQCEVLAHNAIIGTIPTWNTRNILILVAVVGAEVARWSRRILVLVHPLNPHRIVGPTLLCLYIRLVQPRLLIVRVNVLAVNLLLGFDRAVAMQTIFSGLLSGNLGDICNKPGLTLNRVRYN